MTERSRPTGLPRGFWAAFLVAIALVTLGGVYAAFKAEIAQIRETAYRDISSVGKLKVAQITEWRLRRIEDAERGAHSPFFRRAMEEWLRAPEAPGLRQDWRDRLESERMESRYSDALLLAPAGTVLLAARDDHSDPVDPATGRAIATALAEHQAVLSDLYRCPRGIVHFDVAAPLLDAEGRPLAVLVLRSDADRDLFPLIQSWPVPSRSSETLLVRRSGEDIVYLNKLRHRPDLPLSIREPMTRTELPAVQAALGREGPFEGRDYRGVEVLADLRCIPGSSWHIVAKVDTSEILIEARSRIGVIGFAAVLLILLTVAVIGLAYRQRQAGIYQDLFRSERARSDAEHEYRVTLHSLGDAVITADLEHRVQRLNRAAELITGWTEAEARGKPLQQICGTVGQETRADLADHPLLVARDGTERPVAITSAPIKNEAGETSGMVLVIRDQTVERAAHEALEGERANLQAITDSTQLAIMLTDTKGRVVFWNPAAEAMLGHTAQEAVGAELHRLIVPERHRAAHQSAFSRFLQTGHGASIGKTRKLEALRKDGEEIPIELSLSAIGGPDGWRAAGIIRDITRETRLEQQLRESQKMDAVGRLAGGVAHDFNNMLTVILGHAEMAMEGLDPSDPLHRDIQEIMKAGKRSADLVRQLLAFARMQTIAPKEIDLNETVAGMLKVLGRLLSEDIELRWHPGQQLWRVRADPAQLNQLLANLLVNARDAISGIGNVTIETSTAEFDVEYCAQHPGFVPGQYVLLAIGDSGSGMEKETLAKVFEPFFTTKEQGKGTGLGLATVHGIVKQNGGFIEVTSEPGKGTTFRIYLPRPAGEGDSRDKSRAAAEPESGTETILLVEDEATLLDLARQLLAGLGYTVLAAGSPGEALRLARGQAGHIDVLVTDVVMPEMNGRDLWHELVAFRPDLKCLFVSGYTADVIADRGILNEGVFFLQKPYTTAELSAKVREVLSGR